MKFYMMMLHSVMLFLVFGCDFSPTVLPKEEVVPPRIVTTQFKKDSLFLLWNTTKISEKIIGYKVKYCIVYDDDSCKTVVIGESAKEYGYTIHGLKTGVEYSVVISAVYREFESEESDMVKGIAGKPNAPLDFEVKKGSVNWTLNVAWAKNSYNDDFENLEYEIRYWDESDRLASRKVKKIVRSAEKQRYSIEDIFPPNKKYGFELVVRSNSLSSKVVSTSVKVNANILQINEYAGVAPEGEYVPTTTPNATIVRMISDVNNALYVLYDKVEMQKIISPNNIQRIVYNNPIDADTHSILSGGIEDASFFNNPKGFAVDSKGTVYVAFPDDNIIKTIDKNGNTDELDISFPPVSGGSCSTIAKPHNPFIDGNDNLYFFDACDFGIRVIKVSLRTSDIQMLARFPGAGFVDALDAKMGNVLVVDEAGMVYAGGNDFGRLRFIRPNGMSEVLKKSDGSMFDFTDVRGMAVDKKRNLYILAINDGDNAVHMIDAERNVYRIIDGAVLRRMHMDAEGNMLFNKLIQVRKLTMSLEYVR